MKLSNAQRDAIRYAIEMRDGRLQHVNVVTTSILREAGLIEDGKRYRDPAERLAMEKKVDALVTLARDLLSGGGDWEMSRVYLNEAYSIKGELAREAQWVTEKGRAALEAADGRPIQPHKTAPGYGVGFD